MLAAFLCAAAIYPAKSEGQILGDLEADMPFQFHAGNAKLPAGRYTIHRLDDSDEAVLEITSADGRVSAVFSIEASQASTTPVKNELIFNKYGDRYFLSGTYFGSPSPRETKLEPLSSKLLPWELVRARQCAPRGCTRSATL